MVHFQRVSCSLANDEASQWQVPSVNMSYKPIYQLLAEQHTRSKSLSPADTHIHTVHEHTNILAQISGRRSPRRQTSKARALGINRKQSASQTLKATWDVCVLSFVFSSCLQVTFILLSWLRSLTPCFFLFTCLCLTHYVYMHDLLLEEIRFSCTAITWLHVNPFLHEGQSDFSPQPYLSIKAVELIVPISFWLHMAQSNLTKFKQIWLFHFREFCVCIFVSSLWFEVTGRHV